MPWWMLASMGLFSTRLHLASATSGTEACLGRAQVTQLPGPDPQCPPMPLVVSTLSTLTCGSVLQLTKEINSWRVKPVKSIFQRLNGKKQTETESSVDKKTCYHCHRYHDEELKTTQIWKSQQPKKITVTASTAWQESVWVYTLYFNGSIACFTFIEKKKVIQKSSPLVL